MPTRLAPASSTPRRRSGQQSSSTEWHAHRPCGARAVMVGISSLTIVSISRCSSSRVIQPLAPRPPPPVPHPPPPGPEPLVPTPQPLAPVFERANLGEASDIASLLHRRRQPHRDDRL